MWPWSLSSAQTVAGILLYVAAIAGTITAGAGLLAALLQNWVSDRQKVESDARIAEANAGGRTALAEAAKANEGIALAHTETARANVLAASANERAALIEQANLKLEDAIAPRRIADEQRADLVNSLKRFGGHKVQVSSYAMDAEGMLLGHALIRIMQEAGINVSGLTTVVPITMLRAGIHVTALNKDNRTISFAISEAIGKHTSLTVTYNPQIPIDDAQIELGGTGNLGQFEALILIGVKPIKTDSSASVKPRAGAGRAKSGLPSSF